MYASKVLSKIKTLDNITNRDKILSLYYSYNRLSSMPLNIYAVDLIGNATLSNTIW